jgi:uncharacterized protein (DUF362 family)
MSSLDSQQTCTGWTERLTELAHEAGGWGYVPGQGAHIEPTCLALLALSGERDRFASVIDKARQALARFRRPDGSYRLERGREEAVWPTALALFVESTLGAEPRSLEATLASLLSFQGRIADDPKAAEMHDIDHRLIGWPWALGNFSWVEPTAWACLALERAGHGDHPRVCEGRRLLLDRIAASGGANYGNRRIFDRPTESQVEPTALLLLALQRSPEQDRLQTSISYLAESAKEGDDIERLCWAKLALDVHDQNPLAAAGLADLGQAILSAHQSREGIDWLRPAPVRMALMALAFQTERRNVFRLEKAAMPVVKSITAPPAQIRKTFGERVRTAFRTLVLNGAARIRPLSAEATVHIADASNYEADLADVLCRQYESFRERVPLAGKRVVLKPNLVEYHRDRVINTHPNVVAAAIELCQREKAAEIIVAEGPGHCRNVEHLVRASGLGDVLGHYHVRFVDLNHDEPVKTLNLGRLTGLDYLYLAQTVATADVLISMPKLKTHHWAGATLSLKNLFGTLPGICYGWPKNELHWRGIDSSIVDIAMTRTPDLAIVDGIIGMEGDGPLNGTPLPVGALIMGCDPLAVDATCCRIMQLEPKRIGYLMLGHGRKLGLIGENQIRQVGETIASVTKPFATLPHLDALRIARRA